MILSKEDIMKRKTRKVMSVLATAAMFAGALGGCGKKEAVQKDPNVREFDIFAGISALSPDNSEKPVVQQMNEAMDVTINLSLIHI